MKHIRFLLLPLAAVFASCATPPGGTAFKTIDQSSDFAITTKEFVSQLTHENFTILDANRDGVISRGEWSQPGATKAAAQIFVLFDTNRDGKVDLLEFLAKRKQPSKIGPHMAEFDTNRDGKLTWDEIKD